MTTYAPAMDPTAVSGRRFGAYVVDGLVIAAIFWGLFFATAGVVIYERPTTCAQIEAKAGELSSSEACTDDFDATWGDDEYSAATFKPAAWAVAGGAALLYLVLVEWILQAMTGATLGKAIFGIRTVDENGSSPGLGKQLIRGLLWIIDSLCNGLVAAVLILVTKGHRRLGDMAAKTFVVRAGAKGSPIVVPGMATDAVGAAPTTPPAPATLGATPPLAAPAPAPEAVGPQWDAGRNAYIQWDPAGNRWLTYDDTASEWKPIAGEQPPPPA